MSYFTDEDIANLRNRDERWAAVDLSVRVDAELANSLALNLFIEAATRRAEQAKQLLVDINPADTITIMKLQADAQCARLIGEVLMSVRDGGMNAYQDIQEEA